MIDTKPILAALAVAFLLALFAATLRAQPSTAAPEESAELALSIAKVAVNEASLASVRPAEPHGWPVGLSWARHVRRWGQVRELARRLVDGEERFRPCAGVPFTWGGRRIDMARALERGLVPLDCRDQDGRPTINEGFALAGGDRG